MINAGGLRATWRRTKGRDDHLHAQTYEVSLHQRAGVRDAPGSSDVKDARAVEDRSRRFKFSPNAQAWPLLERALHLTSEVALREAHHVGDDQRRAPEPTRRTVGSVTFCSLATLSTPPDPRERPPRTKPGPRLANAYLGAHSGTAARPQDAGGPDAARGKSHRPDPAHRRRSPTARR